MHRLERWIRHIQNAYRRFPRRSRDPDADFSLAVHRKRDEERNSATCPPPDEYIDLLTVWAVEFYTPTHAARLFAGIEALGWGGGQDSRSRSGRDVVEWIRRSRESALSGGWLNLGRIHPVGTQTAIGSIRTAPLPSQFNYGEACIYAVTSSITCIVIGFVTGAPAGSAYDAALRRSYSTYVEPTGARSYRIHDPENQKAAALRNERESLRAAATNWLRQFLPGIFSSGLLEGHFPTCELITLRKGAPFPSREEQPRAPQSYLHLLDVDYGAHAWTSSQIPGLRLDIDPLRDRVPRFHAILAVDELTLARIDLAPYGDRTRATYAAYLQERMRGFVSRWALTSLCAAYERELNLIRDSAIFHGQRKGRTQEQLEALEQHLAKTVDVATCAAELEELTSDPGLFDHDTEDFVPVEPAILGDGSRLVPLLRKSLSSRAVRLRATDRATRDLLTQYGALLSAVESFRLQVTVRWLAWIAIFIAIGIPVVGAFLPKDLPERTMDYLRTLQLLD